MCTSLVEEAEAIGWYEQRLAIEPDAEAAAIMRQAQEEEFNHFSMDLEFLLRRTPLWREIAERVLFQPGAIVERAEVAEEQVIHGDDGRRAGSLADRQPEGRRAVNHLLRSLAPVTAQGWEQLEEEARRQLETALASRRLVDFAGPHGWDHSATNLGRTEPVAGGAGRRRGGAAADRAAAGRAPRAVHRSRGPSWTTSTAAPRIPTSTSLGEAARRMALAENTAVFGGWRRPAWTGSPARRHTSRSR